MLNIFVILLESIEYNSLYGYTVSNLLIYTPIISCIHTKIIENQFEIKFREMILRVVFTKIQ